MNLMVKIKTAIGFGGEIEFLKDIAEELDRLYEVKIKNL